MKCEQCGSELVGEIIKLQDLYCDSEWHYFCSEECAKEWLLENANWDYVEATTIEENEEGEN